MCAWTPSCVNRKGGLWRLPIRRLRPCWPFLREACQAQCKLQRCCVGSVSTSWQVQSPSISGSGSDGQSQRDRLQRRFGRLRALMAKLRWPPVTHFVANGQFHSLPIRSSQPLPANPPKLSHEELAYFVGFFDGDGCVTVCSKRRYCILCVGQSYTRGEVLLRFQAAFGGGIYRHSLGKGLSKPSVQWMITGEAAKRAAGILSQWPSFKQSQLKIAADWPSCPLRCLDLWHDLKRMKQSEFKPESLACSWGYLAGFFDAEGYIFIRATSASIVLNITQKNRAVLDCIHSFLQSEGLQSWTPAQQTGNGYFRTSCSTLATSRTTLQHMLLAGLLGKKSEAELALQMAPANFLDVRASLSLLSGNQSRYYRLQPQGVKRAAHIKMLNHKLRPARVSGQQTLEISHDEKQLWQMREHHSMQCLAERIDIVRLNIRSLLRQGASLIKRSRSMKD
ncbi:unnamed protein product [Polarella glacialis]|uniref:Homing endonuclease LAGLIDADG domain-containing protein n=1 Tax=Polarella glacialis TaxID=89957 RepID=A0A813FQT5_POLGL|nr:unnamed protein product [Polarella glacialis]